MGSHIYLLTTDVDSLLLLENVRLIVFREGKLFYLLEDTNELYASDLQGKEKTLLYTFDEPVDAFWIVQDELAYRIGQRCFMVNTGSGSATPVAISCFPTYNLTSNPKGFYSLSSDGFLEYTLFTGETTTLLGNTAHIRSYAVIEEWLYFNTHHQDVVTRQLCWKIKLDGTELTQLS